MLGNVWEWCADHWRDTYNGAPFDGAAWLDAEAGSAGGRVVRGAPWNGGARYLRAAYRAHFVRDVRLAALGFRCARVRAGEGRSGAAGGEAPTRRAERASGDDRPAAQRSRARGEPSTLALRAGLAGAAALPAVANLLIRSDREELRLRRISLKHPDLVWAGALGRDAFGLYAEFTIPGSNVSQRMRFIPPGRFQMGSPSEERGRFDSEGPQHAVELEHGFWLFDAPCTQALYEAVMGTNPSRFIGPRRPVERVSFEDAQAFIQKVNALVEGLNLSLPSEAQWEYACRAGRRTATYAGDLDPDNSADMARLSEIAWYEGNSGGENSRRRREAAQRLGPA